MWRRPSEINGPSLTYQLWCNEKSFHIDSNETRNEYFNYTLSDLESFTTYSIRVIAQTRNNSEPSERLVIRTKVGLPGRVDQPTLQDMKNGSLKLEWNAPNHLGGHLDFYQLNVSIHKDNKIFQNYPLYRVNGNKTSCLINFNENDNHEVYFYVRAVNINANKLTQPTVARESIYCFEFGETNVIDEFYYFGEWSPSIVHLSFYTDLLKSLYSSAIALVVTLCFALSLLLVFSCCVWRFYQKIQKMKDIKAIYPEGLNPHQPPTINTDADILVSLRGVDLLNTLTDIEEEGEGVSHEFIENGCEDKKEVVEPFMKISQFSDEGVCNSFLIINNKPLSLPSSPTVQGLLLWQSKSIDNSYIKMHKPRLNNGNDNKMPPVGYLDMSGKSPTHTSAAYTSVEVKKLLENSKQNNGYIDRKSIHAEPFPISVNSNGYIAFKKI